MRATITIAAITIANAIRTGTTVVCVCNVLQLVFHACTAALSVVVLMAGHEKLLIIEGNTLKSAMATIIVTVIPTVIGINSIILHYDSKNSYIYYIKNSLTIGFKYTYGYYIIMTRWQENETKFQVTINYNLKKGSIIRVPKPILQRLGNPDTITFLIEGNKIRIATS